MHPFYGPSGRLMAGREGSSEGLASMAAYLAFWAVVVAIAKRELDRRWPSDTARPAAGDPALEALRERYARGEIDRDAYLAVRADLTAGSSLDRRS